MSERRYPTGADVTAYMTDERWLSTAVQAPAVGAAVPIGASRVLEENHRELDVAHVTVVEDSQTTPLYEFTDRLAEEFMQSRSMVNLELQFNYSEAYARRHRFPTIQQIRDKTLWLLMEKARWWPTPAIIRDLVRVDVAYEHSFRHEPNPSASEQVPCTARGMSLVGRREQEIDTAPIARSIEEGEEPQAPGAFSSDQSRYLGKVVEVADGDTMTVRLDATGEAVDVRLVGVDAPETGDSYRLNQEDWNWPDGAEPGRGTPGESPTTSQLVAWGQYAGRRVREVLRPGGEGKKVWLVADPGAAPQDDPGFGQASGQSGNTEGQSDNPPADREGRFLFQVKPTVPFELPNGDTERDLGKWLLKRGLARHVPTTSITAGGENRAADLKRIYRTARSKAGQSGAKGIWYAFDKGTWDAENELTD